MLSGPRLLNRRETDNMRWRRLTTKGDRKENSTIFPCNGLNKQCEPDTQTKVQAHMDSFLLL